MKKLVTWATVVMLLLTAVLTVNAADIRFTSRNCEISNGRLFSVPVGQQGDIALGSAIFDITYPSEGMEFRKVQANSNARLEYIDNGNGTIKLVYLVRNTNLSNAEPLFTLTFKAKSAGSYAVRYAVSGCVAVDESYPNVTECQAANVNIIARQGETTAPHNAPREGSSSGSPQQQNGGGNVAYADEQEEDIYTYDMAEEDAELQDATDASGNIKPATEPSTKGQADLGSGEESDSDPDFSILVPIICIGVSMVLMLIAGLLLGKHLFRRKNSKEQDDSERF